MIIKSLYHLRIFWE